MANDHPFKLKKPCANCPFRNDDQAIDLMPGRISEIAGDITRGDGQLFYCHKTLSGSASYDDETEEEVYQRGEKDSVCAGALIFQLKTGRIPIPARLAFSTGWIDHKGLEAQFGNIIEPEDVL